jgi:predicted GNAT family acetyltransferase
LDKLIWTALSTRQRDFSEGGALARRLRTDVGPFASAANDSNAAVAELTALIPDDSDISLLEPDPPAPPAGVVVAMNAAGVQMVCHALRSAGPNVACESLGDADAEEMRALAHLTRPGPFQIRTHTLGRFIGVRDSGRLVAMAGERLQTDDFVEVSGICTHPDYRGRGLAAALTCAVTQRILNEGRTPFLHAYASNTGAIALYRKLGFELRTQVTHAVWKRAT